MSTEQRSPPGPSTSSNATLGFVYPVKSLLSDKIRPGSPLLTSRSLSDENLVSMVEDSGRKVLTLSSPLGSSSRDAQIVTPGRDVPQAELHGVPDNDALGSPDSPSRYSFSESLGDSPVPNFRHYPAEEHADVAASRKFTSISSTLEQRGHSSETALTMEKLSSGLNQSSALGPHIQPRGVAPTKIAVESTRTETPPPSSAGGATFTSPPPRLEPFNPSQYGLVHLPPLSDNSTSSPISNRSSSSAYYSSRSHNTDQSKQSNEARNKRVYPFLPQLLPQEDTLGNTASTGSIQEVEDDSTPPADSPTTAAASVASTSTLEAHVDDNYHSEASSISFSEESMSASIGQDSSVMSSASVQSSQSHMHTTFRFRHEEDENGNHVVIGREGVLYKCEDEPIRTPGAVQGYGVLIVVEELEETLVVRQVSENSGELLGLPPKFLFSLECFTDTLPESQAGLLWDNIQFLEEPQLDNDTEDMAPHVFLLSGFSAPSADDRLESRQRWSCWCAIHRPQRSIECKALIIMEFEFERDLLNPLFPPLDVKQEPSGPASPMGSNTSSGSGGKPMFSEGAPSTTASSAFGDVNPMEVQQPIGLGLAGEGSDEMTFSAQALMESVTSYSRPIPALERLRRMSRESPSNNARRQGRRATGPPGAPPAGGVGSGVGMMDVFAVVSQINEQLDDAPDLDHFLKVIVGVIKDLTQFHRVMVYQFDEAWNGMVVSELVDWAQCPELYRGLHFPATDIPAQARALYVINKVRVLYDRAQPTARIVARCEEDLEEPLDMTHCYLRAMSPIHIKYLGNMGVRASMSISIVAFGSLWGLVACHSFGEHGMRVSFPVRQILRLLSQSISRNIERLSYAQRLHSRQLINTMPSDTHPTGYIVSNADDLLSLFDADHGVLVVGDAAKILGPNQHGQETLIVAEYLRLKQFETIYASQAVVHDFPDLNLSTGLEILAGLLYVPLSSGGRDFIAFLRKGQVRSVRWAGKPNDEAKSNLEPRTSFKQWSEKVAGRSRAWTDEQLETANVLALVYGKFIEVWRQKQDALHTTKLSNLLLSNANHEVRTPLNHIINYLELALNGQLDGDTRDYLSRTHTASKNLLSTINDLLDLTRLESGGETSLMETFNLIDAINEATTIYSQEAERKGLAFSIDVSDCPTLVVGDTKRIMTVVQNLTANAIKFTSTGSVSIVCSKYNEPEGLRGAGQLAVEICISDTGCGIPSDKLECLFREFEQVESAESTPCTHDGLGLGLAVVARNVAQLRGQLRVESQVDQGSRFSFLIPLSLVSDTSDDSSSSGSSLKSIRLRSRDGSYSSGKASELDALVEVLSGDHMRSPSSHSSPRVACSVGSSSPMWSRTPIRPIKVDQTLLDTPLQDSSPSVGSVPEFPVGNFIMPSPSLSRSSSSTPSEQFRILVVEDNAINRIILSKRLRLDKHLVIEATNGREGLDKMQSDPEFDLILMDIQMPIMDGLEATEGIRRVEQPLTDGSLRVSRSLNGRIPIFAVSASLKERQREELVNHGMDGWVLKPIDFKRLRVLMRGLTDPSQRERDIYFPGCNWEAGGWFDKASDASA